MKAIIVGSSKTFRMIVAKILADIGYDVSVVTHGREAFKKIENEGRPDLVFLGCGMSEGDELAFVLTMKDNPAYVSIPLIIITIKDKFMDMVVDQLAGAPQYITSYLLQRLHDMGFKSACAWIVPIFS